MSKIIKIGDTWRAVKCGCDHLSWNEEVIRRGATLLPREFGECPKCGYWPWYTTRRGDGR